MTPKFPGADCANCPGRDLPFVPAEAAASKARLTIIGERPPSADIAKQRPFVSQGARLLMKGVRYLGLDRSDVHWTHAVPCAVKDKDLPKARKACEGRLRQEIETAYAPIIMPIGAFGIRSVLGLKSAPIMTYRGTVTAQVQDESGKWHLSQSGLAAAKGRPIRYVMPTVHPAAVLRQPLLAPLLEADVQRVRRVMANGWSAPERLEGRQFIYARTTEMLHDGLHAMRGEAIGADVETVGLGPTETSLVCLALSDGPVTVIVPWARASNGIRHWWVDGGRGVAADLSAFLADRVAVTHNGPAFDHIVFNRYGVRIAQWDDTLIGSHAFESHLPKGLARVASSWLDVGPWKTFEDRGAKLTRLWTYNGRDSLYTILSWLKMKERVGR